MSLAAVRHASAIDADIITALCIRSKQSNGYDDEFINACIDELTVTAEMLESGCHLILETTVPVGYAALSEPQQQRSIGEVEAFYVLPGFQRQGFGSQLWLSLLDEARRMEITELRLDADPNALPFYRQLGCKQIGESPSGSIPGRMLPRLALFLEMGMR